jgi:hypothetical protein
MHSVYAQMRKCAIDRVGGGLAPCRVRGYASGRKRLVADLCELALDGDAREMCCRIDEQRRPANAGQCHRLLHGGKRQIRGRNKGALPINRAKAGSEERREAYREAKEAFELTERMREAVPATCMAVDTSPLVGYAARNAWAPQR